MQTKSQMSGFGSNSHIWGKSSAHLILIKMAVTRDIFCQCDWSVMRLSLYKLHTEPAGFKEPPFNVVYEPWGVIIICMRTGILPLPPAPSPATPTPSQPQNSKMPHYNVAISFERRQILIISLRRHGVTPESPSWCACARWTVSTAAAHPDVTGQKRATARQNLIQRIIKLHELRHSCPNGHVGWGGSGSNLRWNASRVPVQFSSN